MAEPSIIFWAILPHFRPDCNPQMNENGYNWGALDHQFSLDICLHKSLQCFWFPALWFDPRREREFSAVLLASFTYYIEHWNIRHGAGSGLDY